MSISLRATVSNMPAIMIMYDVCNQTNCMCDKFDNLMFHSLVLPPTGLSAVHASTTIHLFDHVHLFLCKCNLARYTLGMAALSGHGGFNCEAEKLLLPTPLFPGSWSHKGGCNSEAVRKCNIRCNATPSPPSFSFSWKLVAKRGM